MERYKYLLKNIGLLTIGNFGTKILTFLLIPLYTSILTTGEYGTYDILNTTVTLLLPILSANIVEAVIRFPIGRENERDYVSQIFSIGLRYVLQGCLILAVVLLLNGWFGWIDIFQKYGVYLLLIYITQAVYQILIFFSRAIDRIVDVSIADVLSTLTTLSLNVVFLVAFHWGLNGYFLATIIGAIVPCIYFLFRQKLWQYVYLGRCRAGLTREMVHYSFPFVFNAVGWWINEASDRYIVTWLCGLEQNGIYSVAYKIPAILSVFQSIFNQAWILSSAKEFDPEDKNGFFKNVYTIYNCLMCVVCSVLIILTRVIAKFLFANEFYQAWKYAPLLTIAVIFGTMSGALGGIFTAVKDSRACGLTTCIGAGVNIVLNIILVSQIGAYGAAIATVISGVIVWACRIVLARKYMVLRMRFGRDCIVYGILVVQSLLLFAFEESVLYYVCGTALFVVIAALYRDEFRPIAQKGVQLLRRNK